jgi:hydrophobic/amphiphilic exporter-1 (mainly G- bacteria), HAE1 family
MSLYRSAVNKPVTTLMIFVAIMLTGLYSLTNLPIDQYPEIEPPYVTVITTYSGANASEIETNVTKTLEDAFNSVQGIKEITSTSKDNLSMVTLEFNYGHNLDEAVNDVRGCVDQVYDYLPDECDRPAIYKLSTSMMPILQYTFTAEESYMGLEKLLDDQVANPLKRIDGIGSISVIGAPDRYVYIDIDPNKLDAHGLTLEQVSAAVAGNNVNMPAGSVKMGNESYQLRVQGEFVESSEIKDLVVGTFNGASVFLRDIADVRDTRKDIALVEKANGKQSVRLMITRQSGANSVAVCNQVKKQMETLEKTLPSDIKVDIVYDSSKFIKNSVNELSETLMYALLFVIIVVLFFLGRLRATFIIALTIPISLLSAGIYLFATGGTLNIISLSSLSIAIGLVVDDAIVVLENIAKHIKRGSSPREAAIYATNEVWVSVVVTTLVIVAVFLPLTMISGMMGVMFKQLGWIISITVTISMLAAITITPMLSAKLLQAQSKDDKPRWWDRHIGPALDRLDDWYGGIIHWALRHKKTVIFSALGIFVASMFLFKFIGTDFMPAADQSQLTAEIEVQRGTRVEETLKTTQLIEAYINEHCPEVTILSTSTGSNDDGGISALFSNSGTNLINLTLRLKDIKDRKRSDVEIAEEVRAYLKTIPEVINYSVTAGGMNMSSGASTVDVEIYGFNFDETNKLAQEVKTRCANLPGARDVAISRKDDKAELQVVLDKEKLARHGLNSATVSTYIRNRTNGSAVGYFKEDGDEYDIVVRLKEESRNSISELEELTIPTATGTTIKLKELGEIKEFWSPPNIERKRRERIVTVSITPVGVPLGTMAEEIKTALKGMDVPKDVIINVGGTYEDQQESFSNIGLLLLVVCMLVYVVMASQFESYAKPFVIMFAIPFAISGAAIALFITGTVMSMIAALGLIMLVGIVVKNGIVLVDFINLMRDRGLELNEALEVAGKSRLRPVLMTSLTAILGMFPMALGIGEGSEVWAPMGVTIIGGMIFSTIVTLVIVPVLYAVFARHGERDKTNAVRKQFVFMKEKDMEENKQIGK